MTLVAALDATTLPRFLFLKTLHVQNNITVRARLRQLRLVTGLNGDERPGHPTSSTEHQEAFGLDRFLVQFNHDSRKSGLAGVVDGIALEVWLRK